MRLFKTSESKKYIAESEFIGKVETQQVIF